MIAYTESIADREVALDILSIHNCMVSVDYHPCETLGWSVLVSVAEFSKVVSSKFNLVNLLLNGINARYDRARRQKIS